MTNMLWYNSKTNELQSLPPWGSGWIHPDIIASQYADWTQVSADFVPPQPNPSKTEQIMALNSEYDPQILDLQTQICICTTALNDTDSAEYYRQMLDELQTEYQTKLEAIINGNG